MRKIVCFTVIAALFLACSHESAADRRRAEKHVRDSVALVDQERSLAYYQSQLDDLMPVADSLLQYFNYERNEKYQDHGYYVVKVEKLKIKNYELRVMVRDDGKEVLAYRNGKRVQLPPDNEALVRAQHLQIVISDIKECEKRIQRTSLEIQKYQKRLQKSH
jgi:hypothetical protein